MGTGGRGAVSSFHEERGTLKPPGTSGLSQVGGPAFAEIEGCLGTIRNWRLVQLAVTSAGGLAGITAIGWLSWFAGSPPWLRIGVVVVAAAGLILALTVGLVRASDSQRTAVAVDRLLGSDRASTCVELVREVEQGRLSHPWSLERLDAHLSKTAVAVRDCSPAAVFPWPWYAKASLGGPALLLIASLAVWASRQPPDHVVPAESVVQLALRNVEVELQPPAYTAAPTETITGGSGAFEALPGTRVEVRADTTIELSAVLYQVGEGPWLEGEVEDETSVAVGFVVGTERTYRIDAHPRDGREPLHSGPLRILLRSDEAPRVQLVDPPQETVVLDPGEAVHLSAEVGDDFGVRSVEGIARRGDDEVSRMAIAGELESGPNHAVSLAWSPPLDLGGGSLELTIRVTDNDDVGGPKVTESKVVRVQVLTEADRHLRVLQAQAELFEVAITALGDHLMWLDDPVEERAARARERMADLLDAAQRLRDAYQRDPRPDRSGYAAAGVVVDDVTRSWDRVRPLDPVPGETLSRHVRNLERMVLVLDRQMTAARSEALADASREAAEATQRLEEALARGDAEAIDRAMAELARKMAEVRQAMAQMADSPVMDLANVPRSQDMTDLATQLQSLLAQGKTDEARQLLQQVAGSLSRMAAGGSQGMSRDRLDALMAEIEGLAERQQRANAEMADLAERFPELTTPEGAGALSDRIEDLEKRVSRLVEVSMDPRLEAASTHRVRRDRSHLREAQDAISRGDLDRAIRAVALGDNELLDLMDMAEIFRRAGSTGMDDFSTWNGDLGAAEGDHLGLIESLLDAERAQRESRAAAALPAVGTAARQRDLADDAEAFAEQLAGQNDPFAGGEVQQAMFEASEQLMRAAASDLDVGRTGRALHNGQEALQHLHRARDELQQAREMANGAMALGAAPGWSYFETSWSSGRVEIPPPDPARRLEELRRMALKAAAEDAPPSYESLNDAYYEELVR